MCEEQGICSGGEDGGSGSAVDDDGDQVDYGKYAV
jgi:hypothetical protein